MRKENFKTVYRRLHTTDDIRVPCKEFIVPRTAPSTKPSPKYGQFISLALGVMIFGFSMSSVFASGTISYFSDVESSLNNLLRAGTLDFTVALADPVSSNIKLTAGAASVTVIPTVAPGAGDFPLAYKVSVQKMGGTSDALCNAIDVSASAPSFSFSGKLVALAEGTTTIVSPLSLSLSLPANSNFTLADTCMMDIVYSGWVDGQTEGIEYHDVERVSLTISDPPAATSTDANALSGTAPVIQAVITDATTTVSTDSTTTPTTDSTSTPQVDGGGTPPPADSGTSTPPVTSPTIDSGTTTDTTTPPPPDTTTPPPSVDTTTPSPANTTTVDTPPPPDTPVPDAPPPADTTTPPSADTTSN